MDLDILLNEISQTEKDRYCMISLIMWNLKKPNLYRQESTMMVTKAQGGGKDGVTGEILKATNFQLKCKFKISSA